MQLSIKELTDRYILWADAYYRHPDGTPTRHVWNIRDACRELLAVFPDAPASSFGLAEINQVQQAMVNSRRLCRTSINKRIKNIRHLFSWAANQGLVDDLTPHRLSAVRPLKRGRTRAKEPEKVTGVSWDAVSDTLPHLPMMYAVMVELQWLTAMRPGEVCVMRLDEIEMTSEDLWHYKPSQHKTAHHGITRRISLGPVCINLLKTWVSRVKGEYLFESHSARRAGLPVTPNGYYQAVRKACKAAKVKRWSPAKIRHSALTRTYQDYDIQYAAEQAGHTSAKTTRQYIDVEDVKHTLADVVAKNMG